MPDEDPPFASLDTTRARPLEYGRAGIPVQRLKRAAIEWPIALLIIGAVAYMLLPSVGTTGRPAIHRCWSAIRHIALAAASYAQDHGGAYPTSYADLLPRYINTPTLHCVSAGKGAMLGSRGSFVYCGGALNVNSSDSSIVAYEHPSNHLDRKTVNIGYIDGSVRELPMAQAQRIIDELQLGYNPPRPEKLRKNPAATSGVAIGSLDDQGQRRSNLTP